MADAPERIYITRLSLYSVHKRGYAEVEVTDESDFFQRDYDCDDEDVVEYIPADLAQSVQGDVREALDAIMLYIDDQYIYPGQFDIVQKWLDSLKTVE